MSCKEGNRGSISSPQKASPLRFPGACGKNLGLLDRLLANVISRWIIDSEMLATVDHIQPIDL